MTLYWTAQQLHYQEEILVIKRIITLLIVTNFCGDVFAQDVSGSSCKTDSDYILIGFFNGMSNTKNKAKDNMSRIEETYGYETKNKIPIRYELFFNHSEYLKDLVEIYVQRAEEQRPILYNRIELFWDLLTIGH